MNWNEDQLEYKGTKTFKYNYNMHSSEKHMMPKTKYQQLEFFLTVNISFFTYFQCFFDVLAL